MSNVSLSSSSASRPALTIGSAFAAASGSSASPPPAALDAGGRSGLGATGLRGSSTNTNDFCFSRSFQRSVRWIAWNQS